MEFNPILREKIMQISAASLRLKPALRLLTSLLWIGFSPVFLTVYGYALAEDTSPVPMISKEHPVNWWFVFKFNAKAFPGCGTPDQDQRACPFGGEVQSNQYGQQYVYATSDNPVLTKGGGCVGDTTNDPVGATFDEVYNGKFNYVVWNDQFYDDPPIHGCSNSCGSPWGHSKGMLAWGDVGEGIVLQVSTPSWPASGSQADSRSTDGNTLGCVKDDNVKVSQHFFSLKLSKPDVVEVLKALINASVVTDPTNAQIVHNGGPADVQNLVAQLGHKTHGKVMTRVKLSNGVELISKPSDLNVPPWQMVSATLGGVSMRTATWWATPRIPSTTTSTSMSCWDESLGKPGAVDIAISGQWDGTRFGLKGGPSADFNHAKIGVSTSGEHQYAVFGDMSQQGNYPVQIAQAVRMAGGACFT